MCAHLASLTSLCHWTAAQDTESKLRNYLHENSSVISDSSLVYAEFLTQLARAQALQHKFTDAHASLDQAKAIVSKVESENTSGENQDQLSVSQARRVRVRHLLETGRLLHLEGSNSAAVTPFRMVTQLCRLGLPDDESLSPFLLDAVHMLAIVDPEPSAQFMWNNKAIGICNKSTNPETRAWLASVLNNQGWCFFEAGEYDAALDMFKQALDTRTQRGDAATDIAVARWSVARCLRAMGDYETALQIQLELSADSAAVCEERAHLYRAIGGNDALVRESAAKAIALFKEDEVSPQRLAALRAL